MIRIERHGEQDMDRELENALGALSPLPVPPGLKARTLAVANKAIEDRAMTPRMWSAVAACFALIVVALAGDAIVTRSQMDKISVLTQRPSAPAFSTEDILPILAVLGAGGIDMEALSGGQSFLARSLLARMGAAAGNRSVEFSKRMEGWNDDEGTKDPY